MSSLTPISDHWAETTADYILEQYREADKWKAVLKSVVDKYTEVEENAWKLASVLDFKCRVKETRPTGGLLDFIAGLVNIGRRNGETDADFYDRFLAELGRNNAGTPDSVIYSSAYMSQDQVPQYMDEADATFFVYDGPRKVAGSSPAVADGGGRQLSRFQVKRLSPSGVLGLPGAAIQLADGSLLGDYENRLILAVADDSEVQRELLLADNSGNIVISSASTPVSVVLRGSAVPDIPTIETTYEGVPVNAVRIKDLPAAGTTNSYLVRDSDAEGTTRTEALDESGLDELWDSTPAED